jgi:nitronate monooxygenase
MFQTRITEFFGIQYPIIQGALHWLSGAELVAAVSNAGGLGMLVSAMFPTTEELKGEIRKIKSMTDKPFGVNINLFPTMRPVNLEEYIDVAIEEGVKIFETAGRSPEPYMKRFKQAEVKIMHKAARVRDGITAERVGVDAVTIVGFEGGGHPGMEDITSMIRIPMMSQSVNIPVIAGGGIADARGFVAALALGADGVVMGTRFVLTSECPAHPKAKEWYLKANETETVMVERSIKNTCRALRNKAADEVLELEAQGATLEELLPLISGLRGKKVFGEGDIEAGIASCGQVVGLIDKVITVKEVIDSTISGAKEIMARLNAIASV